MSSLVTSTSTLKDHPPPTPSSTKKNPTTTPSSHRKTNHNTQHTTPVSRSAVITPHKPLPLSPASIPSYVLSPLTSFPPLPLPASPFHSPIQTNNKTLISRVHDFIPPRSTPRMLPIVTQSTPLQVRLLLSSQNCSAILGVGGATIESIRSSSGAFIDVADSPTPRRIVRLNGKREQVQNAAHAMLSQIHATLHHRHEDEVSKGLASVNSSNSSESNSDASSSHSITPPPSNSSIASTVSSNTSSPQLPSTAVSSSSSSPPTTPPVPTSATLPPPATDAAASDAAVGTHANTSPSPYAFSVTFVIPGSQVGAIMGVGGSTLQKTRAKSNATIKITREMANSTERALEVNGELSQLLIAVDLILEQLCQIQTLGAPSAKIPYTPEMGDSCKQPLPIPKSVPAMLIGESAESQVKKSRSRREKKGEKREIMQRREQNALKKGRAGASSTSASSPPSPEPNLSPSSSAHANESSEEEEHNETQQEQQQQSQSTPIQQSRQSDRWRQQQPPQHQHPLSPPLSPKAVPFDPSMTVPPMTAPAMYATYHPLVAQIHHTNAQLQQLITTSVYGNVGSHMHIIQSQIQQLQHHLHCLHSQLYMEQMGMMGHAYMQTPQHVHSARVSTHAAVPYNSPEETVTTLRSFSANSLAAAVCPASPYQSAYPLPYYASGVSAPSTPAPPAAPSSVPASPLVLRLPSFLLGVLIGKNGTMISSLRDRSGATIQIEDPEIVRKKRAAEVAARRLARENAGRKRGKAKAATAAEVAQQEASNEAQVKDPYELRGLTISGTASTIELAAQLIAELIENKAAHMHVKSVEEQSATAAAVYVPTPVTTYPHSYASCLSHNHRTATAASTIFASVAADTDVAASATVSDAAANAASEPVLARAEKKAARRAAHAAKLAAAEAAASSHPDSSSAPAPIEKSGSEA